jgi:formate hydrogenlyase subunit 6/NADH:ubiquinone oxidoreductase subunit I
MGLKEYINDILEAVVTTAKGMRITARYGVDAKEEITLQYPEERWEVAERYRGFSTTTSRCAPRARCA